jgi:hypothetical protein
VHCCSKAKRKIVACSRDGTVVKVVSGAVGRESWVQFEIRGRGPARVPGGYGWLWPVCNGVWTEVLGSSLLYTEALTSNRHG